MRTTTPPSPLSRKTKQQIVAALQKIDSDDLRIALINAAFRLHSFPAVSHEKLGVLQLAYQKHGDDLDLVFIMEEAIKTHITNSGFEIFQNYLGAPFDAEQWNTGFLLFLANELNIPLTIEKVVEGYIQNGKVNWRILEGDNVFYPKQNLQDEDFAQAQTWRMSWEQFRLFKDSGKRSGTVAITKQRFVESFATAYQYQAAFVWSELKRKGILNAKDRLSEPWRMVSNDVMKLQSLTNSDLVIRMENIKKCLKELKDTNKGNPITKKIFIDYWLKENKVRAKIIWHHLIQNEVINKQKKIASLEFEDLGLTKKLNLADDYQAIISTIYKIADNAAYRKKFPSMDNVTSNRKERDRKCCSKEGTVKNNFPHTRAYCTKRWDVSTYGNLSAHRLTTDETANNNKDKLNYDHIPSANAIKQKAGKLVAIIDTQIASDNKELEKILSARKVQASPAKNQKKATEQDKVVCKLLAEEKKIRDKLKNSQQKHDQFTKEQENKDGWWWWTIAIPEKLHRQGATFKACSSDQRASTTQPFLKDVTTYFDILKTRLHEFALQPEDHLKAIGAFRYLYHRETSTPQKSVCNRVKIGYTPQTFFSPEQNKKIDTIFNEEIKTFLEKREGINKI